MDEQPNVAFIGCGRISKSHRTNIDNTRKMRLISTMDVVEEVTQGRAAQDGGDYCTTDLNLVFSDSNIDAVIVCSTHNTHADLTVQALSAGKHIFVEKPPAMAIAEAKSMQRAAHHAGFQVISGWWFKHSPVTKRLRQIVKAPPFILFTSRIPPHHTKTREQWSNDPYARYGLLDLASYNLHWNLHVMQSKPVEVTAMGLDAVASNTSSILIQFENGGIGNSITSLLGGEGILPKHYPEVGAEDASAATLGSVNLVLEGSDAPGIEGN